MRLAWPGLAGPPFNGRPVPLKVAMAMRFNASACLDEPRSRRALLEAVLQACLS